VFVLGVSHVDCNCSRMVVEGETRCVQETHIKGGRENNMEVVALLSRCVLQS